MKKMTFKQVTIISDSLKCGGQFELSPKLNLITGDDNSIGKSTLAKILLWTVGCDPHFDTTWASLDALALVEFDIGEESYATARKGNQIWLRTGSSWQTFPKITGDYSKQFAKLVDFNALLPSRDDTASLEVPPPAFFFLPFYLDQRESWSKAWTSFSGLLQYKNWQRTIIECHTGYLTDRHFSIEKQIALKTDIKRDAALVVGRIDTTLSVMSEFVPPSKRLLAATPADVDILISNITTSLSELQAEQEMIFSELAKLQIDKEHTSSQLNIAKKAIASLEDDYKFSVENIAGDVLNCPICGTEHDNSLLNRSSILADKDSAAELAASLAASLSKITESIDRNKIKLNATKSKIFDIESLAESHFPSVDDIADDDPTSFIESLASLAVQRKVVQTRDKKNITIKNVERENRAFKKQQKELLSKDEKEAMNAEFMFKLRKYISRLKADGVNLSNVRSPIDYKKLYGSGGAAESVRGLLAYYLATLQQIYKYKNVAAPFIIDTPNQHEQVNQSYTEILELLKTEISQQSQVILCAMDREDLSNFKEDAKVITLTDKKLLSASGYVAHRESLRFLDDVATP
ncbi:hypothetical protein ABOC32_06360 [Pseudomonas sp. WOUb67]|uniref:hypothetical protein n=1 Tax=Pseudomonas sp. WOUb67 TaxID=3161136 RepID=UPI003CEF310A